MLIFFLYFLLHSSSANLDESEEALTLKMEHSFDNGKTFSPRGTISIHSLKSGSVSIQQNDLSQEERNSIEKLCEHDQLYLLRSSQADSLTLKSAVHGCNLVRSGLSDLFNIQLDWRSKIVAIHLSTPSYKSNSANAGFKSKAIVQQMESGPAPDTASFIQRMEEEKLAKQRGETKDNRGFFAK